MRKLLGFALFIIGTASIIIHFTHLHFIYLTWIDQWGRQISWLIRVGITLIGALLYLLYKDKE